MKKNKIIYIINIIGIILQNFLIEKSGYEFSDFAFCIGYKSDNDYLSNFIPVLYVIFPYFLLVFLFNECTYDITHNYGKIFIIRHYSKSKLLIIHTVKNSLTILSLIFIQFAFSLITSDDYFNINPFKVTRSLILYYIVILNMLILQQLLELIFRPQNVCLFLIIFSFVSYIITYIKDLPLLKLLFIFSLGFGIFNNAIEQIYYYYFYIIYNLLINIILMGLLLYRFKNTDIY